MLVFKRVNHHYIFSSIHPSSPGLISKLIQAITLNIVIVVDPLITKQLFW